MVQASLDGILLGILFGLSSNNLMLNGALDYQSSLIYSEIKDTNSRLSSFQGNIKNSCALIYYYIINFILKI